MTLQTCVPGAAAYNWPLATETATGHKPPATEARKGREVLALPPGGAYFMRKLWLWLGHPPLFVICAGPCQCCV